MLTYKWRRRGQKVIFSWSISSYFTILHVDLWLPGHFIDRNCNVLLMNVMCDMNQFVIVVPVPNKIEATLAEHFMQHVLLNLEFGILLF